VLRRQREVAALVEKDVPLGVPHVRRLSLCPRRAGKPSPQRMHSAAPTRILAMRRQIREADGQRGGRAKPRQVPAVRLTTRALRPTLLSERLKRSLK
jgi:hypothetical protein